MAAAHKRAMLSLMPSDSRVHLTFHLGPTAKDWLDNLAHEHRTNRSTAIRLALLVAKRHESELIQLLKDQT